MPRVIIKCGHCRDEMHLIEVYPAGQVYACGRHGSAFIAYHELDAIEAGAPVSRAPGATVETALTPYMPRAG